MGEPACYLATNFCLCLPWAFGWPCFTPPLCPTACVCCGAARRTLGDLDRPITGCRPMCFLCDPKEFNQDCTTACCACVLISAGATASVANTMANDH
ncbi:hypothetical protein PAPYR_6402 [Paratrimastix pyriformis]|uniref:Secreted protein n=1 Tax=Paratrimastix pyriformis TaxID=342808 RepID=A0ABQ8UHX9_9EUKA|nr:hypothetical protein PAPYR_6402 [Paratrimastix pyriformis]